MKNNVSLGFRTRSFGFVAALLAPLSLPLDAAAQKADTIEKTLNFAAAKSLRVAGLSAQLSIENAPEPGIRLNLTGSKRQVEAVLTEETDDAQLLIKGNTTEFTGSSAVIVSRGGVASVTIGGNGQTTVIATDAQPPLRAIVRLGAAMPISISGFSGSAAIAARQAPLEFELASGEAELAGAVDANLSIAGSGAIVLDRAAGGLTIAIRGSGKVLVRDADLDELAATVLGAGDLQVRGYTERADLALTGAGNIYVEAVERQPQRRLVGVGRIVIGNW